MTHPRRAHVLGCPIDRLDMDDTVRRCAKAIDRNEYVQQVSINVAKLISLQEDPALRAIVTACGLINADGQGVVWASRLLGDPLPERVAGIDLMFRLLALAERRGDPIYVLGAKPDVLERAAAELRRRYPRLRLSGFRHGYFSDDETTEVRDAIRDSGARILFVAISSPRKEYFLGEHGAALGVPVVMGVGGSIDVVAGVSRRAPRLFQRLGLEWLYRLLQEPRRLGPRYLRTNAQFAVMLIRALRRRASSRAQVTLVGCEQSSRTSATPPGLPSSPSPYVPAQGPDRVTQRREQERAPERGALRA